MARPTPPSPPAPPSQAERLRRDHRLFERWRDHRDPVDRDAIVERFLPLARQLAARYQRPSDPFDDLFQVACYGLVKAVDRFDTDRGIAFSSYAVPTMTGEIKRHFRDRGWSVRVPRDLQELALRVERELDELTRELGRQPTVDEIAHAAEVAPDEVLEAMQASSAHRATSLDAPRRGGDDDTGQTMGDTLGQVEDGFGRAEQRADLDDLIRTLPVREREVIRLRFDGDLTQIEIGQQLGVSQMQVSRLLRRALERLRVQAAAA